MKKFQLDWLKYMIGFLVCLIIRLIPFRVPNIEPVLITQMPFAKKYGAFSGFIFGIGSIFIYDLLTGKVGVWTFVTGLVYGLVGIGAYYYFKNKSASPINFLKYGIIGTLIYDGLTGLTIGPLIFHSSFNEALIGQIPFTIYHLMGNIFFALVISPMIYKWVIENKNLDSQVIWSRLIKFTS